MNLKSRTTRLDFNVSMFLKSASHPGPSDQESSQSEAEVLVQISGLVYIHKPTIVPINEPKTNEEYYNQILHHPESQKIKQLNITRDKDLKNIWRHLYTGSPILQSAL
jgi:SepF-like predicted cell division protein (DUF552 family)